MSILDERTALSVKKHAGIALRAVGIPDPENFAPHALAWSALGKTQRGVADLSRNLLDKLGADGLSEADARSLGEAHDGLMVIFDLIQGEKDARDEIGQRDARSDGGKPGRPIPPDGEARGDGLASAPHGGWFSQREATEDRSETAIALRPEERFATWAQRQFPDARAELSPGAMLRAVAFGAKTDAERRALSEGTDSAGGYTVPTVLSAALIDRLRKQSVLIRAGARTVPLTSDTNVIAKLLTDPAPAWRAEAGAVAASDPTFGAVTLAPKSLAVLVKFSRELLQDSINIEAALVNAITQAMALEVDRAGMFGSGSDNQPTGLVNISGINTLDVGGKLSVYTGGIFAPLVKARTQILTANAGEPTAFIMHPREDGVLVGTLNGNGDPVTAPAKIAAIPQLVTTSVPINAGGGTNEASIITGNFAHFIIGMRETLRLEVLRELYAATGELAMIAHMRVDFAAEHALAFSHINGIEPEA